jgi:hypothetical protein
LVQSVRLVLLVMLALLVRLVRLDHLAQRGHWDLLVRLERRDQLVLKVSPVPSVQQG